MKIAIVGTGIAGNVVAHRLHRAHDITVYEAAGHIGGHTHTHRIELDGEVQQVDTGFIVFNHRTYPNFVRLLDELGVASHDSSMSFSVRNERSGLEYTGTTLNTLFAQRRNLVRPSFLRMVGEILRFNREAPRLLECDGSEIALGDYLGEHRYSRRFIDDYLVPMGAAIWSTDPQRMLKFPARFFVRFMHNHGMLSVNDRPVWRVVRGGSARYVERLVAPWRHRVRLNCPVIQVRRLNDGVWVSAQGAPTERYDHVFFACHADQALRLLADPSAAEREILGALPFQRNEAVLHTDTSLLPRRRLAWAAWNYHVLNGLGQRVALTYNMNILQGLSSRHTFCVTLNRSDAIDPRHVLKRLTYEHPLFTPAGVAAQQRHHEISGVQRTHYCGAYWRYGFHEDGVVSALGALQRFEQGAHHAQRDLPRVA
ncbi:MAG TPA: FAD-dependent oxidoreductase [Burkholderiaceae bacterium]|nr:FAD-dependent oxidoreductase [Burkholderiaceae bacterium]